MTLQNHPVFTLSREEAAFLRLEPLSILAASHGPNNIPLVARAFGCRLSPSLDRVTLFFSKTGAQEFLSQVAGNGSIAAVFALPSTHQALQLKGSDAAIERLAKTDPKIVTSRRRAFIQHLIELGYTPDLFEAALDCEASDLVAVGFTPEAAFSQTPGPRAGHAIGVAK
jgi:hypothetical protein